MSRCRVLCACQRRTRPELPLPSAEAALQEAQFDCCFGREMPLFNQEAGCEFWFLTAVSLALKPRSHAPAVLS
jgi:hypothetical protein